MTETTHAEFEPDSYVGACGVCGLAQTFVRRAKAIRETYHCGFCRASLRERLQAEAIMAAVGAKGILSLKELSASREFADARIFEPGTSGPFRRYLKGLQGYVQSDYYPPGKRPDADPALPHQDLHALSFPDVSFDLVITSDILEHVRRPMQAFAEIRRVLRPGGWHVFTVPMQAPIPERTVARVATETDVDVYLMPPHYHGDGKGGRALVYNVFGADLLPALQAIGLKTEIRLGAGGSDIANKAATLVSQRMG